MHRAKLGGVQSRKLGVQSPPPPLLQRRTATIGWTLRGRNDVLSATATMRTATLKRDITTTRVFRRRDSLSLLCHPRQRVVVVQLTSFLLKYVVGVCTAPSRAHVTAAEAVTTPTTRISTGC